jgi:hypothetical protein
MALAVAAGACSEPRDEAPARTSSPERKARAAESSLIPSASATVAAPSSSAVAGAKEIVVYEGGSIRSNSGVRSLVGPDALVAEAEHALFERVFGAGRYLRDAAACRGDSPNLEAARLAGDFAPRALEVVDGAFTKAGAKQRAYLLHNAECGATHADNFGTATLAVFEGEQVVARANLPGGASIAGVFDLDGDGVRELLVTFGFTNMGEHVESASLRRFEGERLVELRDFGQVESSSCESEIAPKAQEVTTVRAIVRPGAPPEFRTETKRSACP